MSWSERWRTDHRQGRHPHPPRGPGQALFSGPAEPVPLLVTLPAARGTGPRATGPGIAGEPLPEATVVAFRCWALRSSPLACLQAVFAADGETVAHIGAASCLRSQSEPGCLGSARTHSWVLLESQPACAAHPCDQVALTCPLPPSPGPQGSSQGPPTRPTPRQAALPTQQLWIQAIWCPAPPGSPSPMVLPALSHCPLTCMSPHVSGWSAAPRPWPLGSRGGKQMDHPQRERCSPHRSRLCPSTVLGLVHTWGRISPQQPHTPKIGDMRASTT